MPGDTSGSLCLHKEDGDPEHEEAHEAFRAFRFGRDRARRGRKARNLLPGGRVDVSSWSDVRGRYARLLVCAGRGCGRRRKRRAFWPGTREVDRIAKRRAGWHASPEFKRGL